MYFYCIKFGPDLDYGQILFSHEKKWTYTDFVQVYNDVIEKLGTSLEVEESYLQFISHMNIYGFHEVIPLRSIYNKSFCFRKV
ncbi:TPA: hypothetical protein SAQ65_002574 [Bacillus cereus]|nr:hypothetical protein [Bacillus cereus]